MLHYTLQYNTILYRYNFISYNMYTKFNDHSSGKLPDEPNSGVVGTTISVPTSEAGVRIMVDQFWPGQGSW